MNEIMNIHGVECYEKDGVAYLKLEAVARGLGFSRIAESGNEVVRWDRVNGYLRDLGVPTCGHDAFIPENVFYRLAMKAKNAVAEAFQAKVADEIIPSIRKHGAYMTPETIEKIIADPDTMIQLCVTLKEERRKREELEAGLGRSKEWYSIKRVAHKNGMTHKDFDWRKLKEESIRQGYGIRKIFDANYGEVNTYHMQVWEKVYPRMEL